MADRLFPRSLGPLLAAFAVTAGVVWGRAGVRDLLARMARWPCLALVADLSVALLLLGSTVG